MSRPTVIIRVHPGEQIPMDMTIFGDARLLIIDENVPTDRAYEFTTRQPVEDLADHLKDLEVEDHDIGNKDDGRLDGKH